jgi:hypothetical protein
MSQFTLKSQAGIVWLGLILLTVLSLITYLALPSPTSGEDFWLSVLIICLGACIGALLAALVSPLHSSEDQAFKLVAGIASAFLAGFVWNSFETDIRGVLAPILKPGSSPSTGPAKFFAFGVAIFLSAFLNYAFRAYSRESIPEPVTTEIDALKKAIQKLEVLLAKNSA